MENKKELGNWLNELNLDHPLVIAGPCSAETEEQVLRIAHELKDTDVSYYRAGIWKPEPVQEILKVWAHWVSNGFKK